MKKQNKTNRKYKCQCGRLYSNKEWLADCPCQTDGDVELSQEEQHED